MVGLFTKHSRLHDMHERKEIRIEFNFIYFGHG